MAVDIEKATVFHWLYEQAKGLYKDVDGEIIEYFPGHVKEHFVGKRVVGIQPWSDSWRLDFEDGSYLVFSQMETIAAWTY